MSGEWIGTSTTYIDPGGGDAWGAEAFGRGARGSQRLRSAGEVVPPREVAEILGVGKGEKVVERRRVMLLDDRPVELTDSYYPLRIAAGTVLAELRKIPGGAVKALADLGAVGAEVSEDVGSRPASPAELAALQLHDGEWVITLFRVTRSSDATPIEVSVMTMPARHCKLHYDMKVG